MRSPGGSNCEESMSEEILLRNHSKLRWIINNSRKNFNNVSTSIETVEESSNEFEDSCSTDTNDELRIDNEVIDFLNFNHRTIDTICDNATVYMANACIKKIIKNKSCDQCAAMLEFPLLDRQDPGFGNKEYFLTYKANSEYELYRTDKRLSYGQVLKENVFEIFLIIVKQLSSIVCNDTFNKAGLNVKRNILRYLYRNETVKAWITDDCRDHRKEMIDLFVRANLFNWVKRYRETHKPSRNMNQTIQDLRFD